ncbi:hypothetical protein D3C77_382550 [compost metagenome]
MGHAEQLYAGSGFVPVLHFPFRQSIPVVQPAVDDNIVLLARTHGDDAKQLLVRQDVQPIRTAVLGNFKAHRIPRLLEPFILPHEQYGAGIALIVNVLGQGYVDFSLFGIAVPPLIPSPGTDMRYAQGRRYAVLSNHDRDILVVLL